MGCANNEAPSHAAGGGAAMAPAARVASRDQRAPPLGVPVPERAGHLRAAAGAAPAGAAPAAQGGAVEVVPGALVEAQAVRPGPAVPAGEGAQAAADRAEVVAREGARGRPVSTAEVAGAARTGAPVSLRNCRSRDRHIGRDPHGMDQVQRLRRGLARRRGARDRCVPLWEDGSEE